MMLSPRRGAWLGVVTLATLAVAVVAVPVFLIQPFAPQSPVAIALAFALRRWSPWLTLAAMAGGVFLLLRLWPLARLLPRIVGVMLVVLTGASAWMSRQNHFEWMFVPLPDARFARAGDAPDVSAQDMVLAVRVGGDAVAYPVRQLAYHHVVEDSVGGVPIVATY